MLHSLCMYCRMRSAHMSEKTYNVKEASEMLGISRVTAYDWMESGKLRYVLEGKAIKRRRIPESAIHELLMEAEQKAERGESSFDATPAPLPIAA